MRRWPTRRCSASSPARPCARRSTCRTSCSTSSYERPCPRSSAVARIATAAAAAARSGGCGFHLQGSAPLPRSIALVRIETSRYRVGFLFRPAQGAARRRHAHRRGRPRPSATVIHVLTDAVAQRVLTVSALNVPTEYELSYSLKFSVTASGSDLIEPESHVLVRDYNFSENAAARQGTRDAHLQRGAGARPGQCGHAAAGVA